MTASPLAAYLGGSTKFDQAIADFAETYADQNERDYAAPKPPSKTAKPKPPPRSNDGEIADRDALSVGRRRGGARAGSDAAPAQPTVGWRPGLVSEDGGPNRSLMLTSRPAGGLGSLSACSAPAV